MRHADPIDAASEHEAMLLAVACTYRRPEGPRGTGLCLSCGEPVESPRRWCDAECRDQWEKENM